MCVWTTVTFRRRRSRSSPRFGALAASGILGVEAYPDRFTIQLADGATHTVLAGEITSVQVASSMVRVAHTVSGLASPVGLNLAETSPVRQAIERLHPTQRLRWQWNWAVTGLVLGGLAFIGAGTYFLAGDSPWYTAVWIGVGVLAVGRPILRAGLQG
jgi:hypothetical protein